MTSTINKTSLKKNVSSKDRPILPRLLRVHLASLECARNSTKNSPELKASITRALKVGLVEHPGPEGSCQIILTVELQGTWTDGGLPDPVITLAATYNAKFNYPTRIEGATASRWIDDEFYREALVSAAMPVINLHVYSQLDMMGISTSAQPLGFSSQSSMKKIVPKKLPRRKNSPPELEA